MQYGETVTHILDIAVTKETGDKKHLQSHKHFEGIVNSPLCTSQSTNHDNSKRQPSGEQSHETHLLYSLQIEKQMSMSTTKISSQSYHDHRNKITTKVTQVIKHIASGKPKA